ncbi:MAG: OmpA family protein [Maribacter sp.]|nr:OmpA family protein [Maribacter sp.]
MTMKTPIRLLRYLGTCFLIVGFATNVNGQFFKKLGKAAERAAEKTVERRVESETSKKTDAALDSILEPGSKGKQQPPQNPPTGGGNDTGNTGNPQGTNTPSGSGSTGGPQTMQVYSKFDFVAGDKILYYDDFSNDFVGDFPSKWNTNGTGEVVTINEGTEKWFEIKAGSNTFYIPDIPNLPEEYTIEFDIMATGLDANTTSSALLNVILTDDDKFKWGNYVRASLPFCQYHPIGIRMRNKRGDINNTVTADIRKDVIDQPHVSVAVNKERFRLWVNEKKYVDIPRIIPTDSPPTSLKFELVYFEDGKERFFIKNLKVAEGGVDLRRKLIAEGEVSTNGILFDSGSANIQPQSMGIIRQISQVLQQEQGMSLMIEGHTDSDGEDASNMDLSKRRAEAVRNALIDIYKVSGSRLQTSGKGETEPVGDNGTTDGKAQNRRVVFVKL